MTKVMILFGVASLQKFLLYMLYSKDYIHARYKYLTKL